MPFTIIIRGGTAMAQTKATNIILQLRREGWDDAKINSFIALIETHNPTEEEVIESNRLAQNNSGKRKAAD